MPFNRNSFACESNASTIYPGINQPKLNCREIYASPPLSREKSTCIIHFNNLLRFYMFRNQGLKRLWICANNLADLLSVSEQYKCRHSADTEFLCRIWDIVYVELVEFGGRVLLGEPIAISVSKSW
jgi:hypothetical protein